MQFNKDESTLIFWYSKERIGAFKESSLLVSIWGAGPTLLLLLLKRYKTNSFGDKAELTIFGLDLFGYVDSTVSSSMLVVNVQGTSWFDKVRPEDVDRSRWKYRRGQGSFIKVCLHQVEW